MMIEAGLERFGFFCGRTQWGHRQQKLAGVKPMRRISFATAWPSTPGTWMSSITTFGRRRALGGRTLAIADQEREDNTVHDHAQSLCASFVSSALLPDVRFSWRIQPVAASRPKAVASGNSCPGLAKVKVSASALLPWQVVIPALL